jgi:spermidine/putrescine transport system substrate-binding protein
MPESVADSANRTLSRTVGRRSVSRRHFLKRSGQATLAAGAALSLPSLLAACGIGPAASPTPGSQTLSPAATPTGTLSFGNWPLYIDIDEDTSAYPSLEKFRQETGTAVTYAEAINDNEEFFGRIQPDLAAGRYTGYDIIVPTDWMVERMARLGYLMELDHSRLPNFTANVMDLYRDPWYDPGHRYSVPWVAGSVGIGYNPTLTGREITTFDDLLDPAFAGQTGLFREMRDTLCLAVLSLGVDAEEATVEDAQRAQAKLLEAAQRGQFRAFYGNDYYDQLSAGNLALTMAWSGDVSQMKLYDNEDVEFVIPDSGGMLYVDNMVIPRNPQSPVDAHQMMDFWYELDNAAALIEYIGFFSPVEGVPERVLEHAAAAREEGDDEWADALEVIAGTSVPDPDTLSRLHRYPILDEATEREWNDLFNALVAG